MFKLNKIIGVDESKNNILVTLEDVIEILTNPKLFGFGPLAEEYLTDETLKHDFDAMKKDAGYAY